MTPVEGDLVALIPMGSPPSGGRPQVQAPRCVVRPSVSTSYLGYTNAGAIACQLQRYGIDQASSEFIQALIKPKEGPENERIPHQTPTRTVASLRYSNEKSLGQNFLPSPGCRENTEAGQVDADTTVEIASFDPIPTTMLSKVLAFEIDQRFVGILQETLADCTSAVQQDILSVDLAQNMPGCKISPDWS